MNKIVPFLPKSTLKRQEALDTLVGHYKAFMRKPLDNPINARQKPWEWSNFRWPGLGRFMKYEFSHSIGSTTKILPLHMALPDKTLDEVQAMTLHFIVTNSGKSDTTFNTVLRALLMIEATLRRRSANGIANFTDLKASDLDNAIQLGSEITHSDKPSPPEYGRDILVKLGVVTSSSVKNWVNAASRKHKREYNQASRGENSETIDKLPDMKAVIASAEYFATQPWLTKGEDPAKLDEDQRNVIVSSVLAIISLLPCRYQELIKNLPENCFIRQPESTVGEVLGLHWYADKTDMTHVKWVPYTASGTFEAVIEEAVARLKYLTEDARALLRSWDCNCPEYNESEFTKAQNTNRLPAGWPWSEPDLKLRYSDTLFVCLKYQTNTVRHTIENTIEVISTDKFRDWLRTKKTKNSWTGEPLISRGFFDRIGHQNFDLKLDDYNTHAYRHMVNTAARLGGMSEFDINMWSHRSQSGQGEVYNHTTGEQRRNLILHGDYKAKELTPEERLNHINHNMPMTRKNLGMRFEIIGNNFGGFTFNHPLGTCTHNYIEGPCLRNMDCVMCPENMHCKGDKRALKNLNEEFKQTNDFLQMALTHDDRMGINRYEVRSEILGALVDVLGDNSPLSDGDLVILSPNETPKAGLLERARMAAEQIKKNQTIIEQRHETAKSKLGITRSLPILDNEPSETESENNAINELDSSVDEFLLDFED
jgi:hypothetical protein